MVFIDKLADLISVEFGGGAEGAGPLDSSLRFLRWDSQRHFKRGLVYQFQRWYSLVGGGAEGAGPLGSSLRFLRWDSQKEILNAGLEISSRGGIHR